MPPTSSVEEERTAWRFAGFWVFALFPVLAMVANRGHLAILALGLGLTLLWAWYKQDLARLGPWRAVLLQPTRWPPLIQITLAIVVLADLSATWNAVPALSLSRAAQLAAIIVVAALWHRCLINGNPAQWLRPALIGLLLALLFIAEEVYGPGWFVKARQPGVETILNRSFVTASLWVWPVVALAIIGGRRKLALGLIVAAVVAIAGSTSQSASMGLVIGAITFAAMHVLPQTTRLSFAIAAPLLMLATPFLIPWAKHHLDSGQLDRLANWSAGIRLDIWDAYARAVPERFWVGWGADAGKNFGRAGIENVYQPSYLPPILPQHHPHNAFLQVWVDLGFAGAILSAGLLILLTKAVGRLRPALQAPAMAALAAATFIAFVSHGLWQSWWLMLSAMLVAVFAAIGRPRV